MGSKFFIALIFYPMQQIARHAFIPKVQIRKSLMERNSSPKTLFNQISLLKMKLGIR